MLKTDNAERVELYKDPSTQAFLSRLLSGEIIQVEPVYDSKLGYHYPLIEAMLGKAQSAEVFLNKLYKAGILKRRLYDKIISCPRCRSVNVSVRYCCPYCKSFNIQKSSLIEHVKCGYMDVEENFHHGTKLVCPKCHEELKKLDIDHRKAGIWCNCKDCDKSFDIPATVNFCRQCHGESSFEEILIKDVYAYSIKQEVKEEANMGWILIAPIREFLAEEGLKVESPAFLKGKSGANHMFDIVAYGGEKGQKVTVIDLATSIESAVSEQPIIALFAKIFDVSPDNAYLIAIPMISENGKKMATLYNIQIIEAKDQNEVVKALKEKMKSA